MRKNMKEGGFLNSKGHKKNKFQNFKYLLYELWQSAHSDDAEVLKR